MPQIVVSYSDNLSKSFDGEGFARDLHQLASVVVGSPVDDFKTRFVPVHAWFVGDGQNEAGLVSVEIGLLSGRTDAVRAELARVTLELLRGKLSGDVPTGTQLTVELRDMHRPSYTKHVVA